MVLLPVSQDYPLLVGRSCTRYSPVRRSLLPESNIPLDLHVLGLPLAFILSQDQTLHSLFLITLSSSLPLSFLFFFSLFFNWECKDITISIIHKLFYAFF